MTKDELLRAHEHSGRHREALSTDQRCGCFYCQKIFSSNEIEIWIDEGKTALCPFCCIDSVIGESSGYEINEDFLRSMHLFFFESATGSKLCTPFGDVVLRKDGKKCSFCYEALVPRAPYENVDGIYKLEYLYESDGKEHTVELILDNSECEGGEDSGEGMTAITADIGGGRITVAYIHKDDDFCVEIKKDGLKVMLPAVAPSQTLTFGVCFMNKLPSPDSVETWLGADVE